MFLLLFYPEELFNDHSRTCLERNCKLGQRMKEKQLRVVCEMKKKKKLYYNARQRLTPVYVGAKSTLIDKSNAKCSEAAEERIARIVLFFGRALLLIETLI